MLPNPLQDGFCWEELGDQMTSFAIGLEIECPHVVESLECLGLPKNPPTKCILNNNRSQSYPATQRPHILETIFRHIVGTNIRISFQYRKPDGLVHGHACTENPIHGAPLITTKRPKNRPLLSFVAEYRCILECWQICKKQGIRCNFILEWCY